MKKYLLFTFLVLALTSNSFAEETLLIFAGAASKPVLEEINKNFEKENNIKIETSFGGSGGILSQMKLAKKGDLYIPGSSDFMEKAKKGNQVLPETEEIIAYLIPSICVQAGNPLKITGVDSLVGKDIKLGIGVPGTVCVGLYAVEIIEGSGLKEKIKPEIVTNAESCEKTASLVAMKNVDAVFGWSVFENWIPDKIKSIPIEPKYFKRIGYIPAAVSVYCKNKELAVKYIKYLKASRSQEIFRESGYITAPEELNKNYPGVKIGGSYLLPDGW
ncbi:MAG: molybdate ABC transporter substrate-binding protein [bacterium]|nr:molybdate ABC transporter substrate-binding protein [bacterium]